MEALAVIKIGGNIIDDPEKLDLFLEVFTEIGGRKILVHGGGKLATRLAEQLGVPQQLVDGRRITDAETLKIVTMVYAGHINKNIVAQLQAKGCNAVGLCGADGNAILAHKRGKSGAANEEVDDGGKKSGGESGAGGEITGINKTTDYGYAGDVDRVNGKFLGGLLEQDKTLIFAPITHDGKGQLLNTNADTIAREIARALSAAFAVTLVYSFESSGVLMDTGDDHSVIRRINPASYKELKERKIIFAGMIPKLDNAFAALGSGVRKVIIGKAEELHQLLAGQSGTMIMRD
jgi:acetylglutamate kinase